MSLNSIKIGVVQENPVVGDISGNTLLAEKKIKYSIAPEWRSRVEKEIPEDLQGVVLHYPVVGSNNPQNNDDGISNNDMGLHGICCSGLFRWNKINTY